MCKALATASDCPLCAFLHSITYNWIKAEIEHEEAQGGSDRSKYSHSMVVGTLKPTDLGSLRQADGQETFEDKK